MKTDGPKTNFRVVIEPRRLGDFGFISASDSLLCKDGAAIEKAYIDRCEDICKQVMQHVGGVRNATIEFDHAPVCSHCGCDWTETSETYNGGCCDQDQEADDARLAADEALSHD